MPDDVVAPILPPPPLRNTTTLREGPFHPLIAGRHHGFVLDPPRPYAGTCAPPPYMLRTTCRVLGTRRWYEIALPPRPTTSVMMMRIPYRCVRPWCCVASCLPHEHH
jgi:hypothetical protein